SSLSRYCPALYKSAHCSKKNPFAYMARAAPSEHPQGTTVMTRLRRKHPGRNISLRCGLQVSTTFPGFGLLIRGQTLLQRLKKIPPALVAGGFCRRNPHIGGFRIFLRSPALGIHVSQLDASPGVPLHGSLLEQGKCQLVIL